MRREADDVLLTEQIVLLEEKKREVHELLRLGHAPGQEIADELVGIRFTILAALMQRTGGPGTDRDEPVGCYGPEASAFTKEALEGQVVKLETPRLGDATDAYGRMLAYVYLDLDGDQLQEEMFNMDLIEGGYARTTTFAHSYYA